MYRVTKTKTCLRKKTKENNYVLSKLGGDFNRYNKMKRSQEHKKKMMQNDPSRLSEALMKFAHHIIRFPSWYDVADCSELFTRKNLYKVENESVSNGKEYLIRGFEGNSIIVLMNELFKYYDLGEFVVYSYVPPHYSAFSPCKKFVFKHVAEGSQPNYQSVKHQPRLIGQQRFDKVVGLEELSREGKSVLFIVTDKIEQHRRYVHRRWEDICHNEGVLPIGAFKPMRVCYEIHPETIEKFEFTTKNNIRICVRRGMIGKDDPVKAYTDGLTLLKDIVTHNFF